MKNLKLDYKQTEESRDLTIYIVNDGDFYRGCTTSIIKNLAKKYEKGIFDTEKAIKSFYNLANLGAKKYAKYYGNPNEWNRIFSVSDRKATSCELLEYYFENINGQNPIG